MCKGCSAKIIHKRVEHCSVLRTAEAESARESPVCADDGSMKCSGPGCKFSMLSHTEEKVCNLSDANSKVEGVFDSSCGEPKTA